MYHSRAATLIPFFNPSCDGVARDTEGASQSAQRTALIISAHDLFAFFSRVGVCAWLLAAALLTIAAHQIDARAMLTS